MPSLTLSLLRSADFSKQFRVLASLQLICAEIVSRLLFNIVLCQVNRVLLCPSQVHLILHNLLYLSCT